MTAPSASPGVALWLLVAVVLMALWAGRGHAGAVLDEPILGGSMLVATDGYVTAQFIGSDAGYFNRLHLLDPEAADHYLFDKDTPLDNAPVNLGWFSAGTELVFRMDVRNTGLSFFTGDGARNPDGIAHALAVTSLDEAGVYVTTVGFEDLSGGGDLDYNDFMFRLTNIVDPLLPAPGVLLLLSVGLIGLRFSRLLSR